MIHCKLCGFIHYTVKCKCEGNEEITQIRKRFAKLKAVAAMEKYVDKRNRNNETNMGATSGSVNQE